MRAVRFLLLVLVVVALVVGRALSDRGREPVSATRAFAIDGRKFLIGDPARDGFRLLERELAKCGIDALPISPNLASALDSRSMAPLREEPAEARAIPLPRGLEPDHILTLETTTGPVDIAFGRVSGTETDLLGQLRSAGWECRESDTHGAPGAIAQLTNRKDASLVLLEKNEKRFLAIRRAVR